MIRVDNQKAFVLHLRPYRETSVILELLTLEHGRIAAIARGVRQAKSKWKSLLQPFTPLLTAWQGRAELMLLTNAEGDGVAPYLQKGNLLSGLYLNELLMRVLPKHDPYPELYRSYEQALHALQQSDFSERTLRLFEKQLLSELGYALPLNVNSGAMFEFDPGQKYYFQLNHGFVLWQEGMPLDIPVFNGSSLIAFAKNDLPDATSLQDAKRLMRLALAPLIGQDGLQSRKLYTRILA